MKPFLFLVLLSLFVSQSLALCGNEIVEVGEECDGGVCCSTNCTFFAPWTPCDTDNLECSLEMCNGSGVCELICDGSCHCYDDSDCLTNLSENEEICLTGVCDDNQCTIHVKPNTCYIDGTCFEACEENPTMPCKQCSPSYSNSTWSNKPPGSPCEQDDLSCTTETCNYMGSCVVQSDNCDEGCMTDCECRSLLSENEKKCLYSQCNILNGTCHTWQKPNTCYVEGVCYLAGEEASQCLFCSPGNSEDSLTPLPDMTSCELDDRQCSVDYCIEGECVASPCNGCICSVDSDCSSVLSENEAECFTAICDFPSGMCVVEQNEDTCFIDSVCYQGGDTNPENTCEVCAPEVSDDEWSPTAPFTPCDDDERSCTQEMCMGSSGSGVCELIEDTCECDYDQDCVDQLTNDEQICLDAYCSPGNGTCHTFQKPNTCYIEGFCFENEEVDELNPCLVCNSTLSETEWSFIPDGTICEDDGICGGTFTCSSGNCTLAIPPLHCDDNNPCTQNHCIEGQGCLYTHDHIACPCDSNKCVGGCTLTQGYWKTHNKYATNPGLQVPWPDDSEDKIICGDTWYDWSQMRTKNFAWRKLFEQWLAAQLNVLSGTCIPASTNVTLYEAFALLNQCDLLIQVSDSNSEAYKEMASILDRYNTGLDGPGHCVDDSCAILPIENDPISPITCLLRTLLNKNSISTRTVPIHDFVDSFECDHGTINLIDGQCYCELGWTGIFCDECMVQSEMTGETFLCVPRFDGDPSKEDAQFVGYILRSISNDRLDLYLNDELVSIAYDYRAVYPGTEGLNCACELFDKRSARHPYDFSHEMMIEWELEMCEDHWNDCHEEPDDHEEEPEHHFCDDDDFYDFIRENGFEWSIEYPDKICFEGSGDPLFEYSSECCRFPFPDDYDSDVPCPGVNCYDKDVMVDFFNHNCHLDLCDELAPPTYVHPSNQTFSQCYDFDEAFPRLIPCCNTTIITKAFYDDADEGVDYIVFASNTFPYAYCFREEYIRGVFSLACDFEEEEEECGEEVTKVSRFWIFFGLLWLLIALLLFALFAFRRRFYRRHSKRKEKTKMKITEFHQLPQPANFININQDINSSSTTALVYRRKEWVLPGINKL